MHDKSICRNKSPWQWVISFASQESQSSSLWLARVRWKRWLFRNSSVRLVYAIDEDVTRSLESPQMRCVVQARVRPSGAGRVKHRRFR